VRFILINETCRRFPRGNGGGYYIHTLTTPSYGVGVIVTIGVSVVAGAAVVAAAGVEVPAAAPLLVVPVLPPVEPLLPLLAPAAERTTMNNATQRLPFATLLSAGCTTILPLALAFGLLLLRRRTRLEEVADEAAEAGLPPPKHSPKTETWSPTLIAGSVPVLAVPDPVVPVPVPEPDPLLAVAVAIGVTVAAVVGEAVALVPDPLLVEPLLLEPLLLVDPLLELVEPLLLAAAPTPASTKV
jgi:hypothetical protein